MEDQAGPGNGAAAGEENGLGDEVASTTPSGGRGGGAGDYYIGDWQWSDQEWRDWQSWSGW